MVSIPQKVRRKFTAFQDLLGEAIYLFGGMDENSHASGQLLKLKVREGEIVGRGDLQRGDIRHPLQDAKEVIIQGEAGADGNISACLQL